MKPLSGFCSRCGFWRAKLTTVKIGKDKSRLCGKCRSEAVQPALDAAGAPQRAYDAMGEVR
jgi:hypothetical protein